VIDAILSRVTGFFEKDFLFASFLPALLFVLAIGGTVLAVAGVPPSLAGMDAWSASRLSLALFAAFCGVTVLAYVLVALRPAMLSLWSGTSPLLRAVPRVMWWAAARRRSSFRDLTAASLAEPVWGAALGDFPTQALRDWPRPANAQAPTAAQLRILDAATLSARAAQTPVAFFAAAQPFLNQLKLSGGDALESVYAALLAVLDERAEIESARTQAKAVELDRRFGSFGTIRPTALGNVITAYQEYPFKRYGMEAEVFWPRLRAVIPQTYFELVQEPRILLDFAVTMASTLVALAGTAVIGGPWLTYHPIIWASVPVGCLAFAYFFYRLAVSAADSFGEFVRACFDLYRLDLMARLHRPPPLTTTIERAQWLELSQIATYGVTAHDVVLTPTASSVAAPP